MLKVVGIVILLVAAFSCPSLAQVRIVVSAKQFKQFERIDTKIVNSGSRPITYCVEYGHRSPKAIGEVETTPTPFFVQEKVDGKWATLMIGPDIGSARGAEVLSGGHTQEFHLRLIGTGQMRLVLEYLPIEDPDPPCSAPLEHPKTVKSEVFTVR